MKLSEIFQALTYGELGQIHIGGIAAQGVDPENYPHMLTHINLGLTELHKRFLLKESTLHVDLQEGVALYHLDRRYAQSNLSSDVAVKYIADSVDDPFLDDLLKIEQVFDDEGNTLLLNAGDDPQDKYHINVSTPAYNKIIVPAHLESQSLRIVYRAKHPEIASTEFLNAEETVVELPYSHLNALLMFVASRVFTPMGSPGEFHDGNNYAAKFEQACMLLDNQGLRIDVSGPNNRSYRGGWV